MLDLDEDRMRDRNEFELEEYREHIPRLRKRAGKAGAIALSGTICAAGEGALFGILPGHPEITLWVGAGMLLVGWISSIVKHDALAQVSLINDGGRPTGVWMKLMSERIDREETDVAATVERARLEGERVAELETDQWWRQPGSLWHQTDEAIYEIEQELAAIEDARKREEYARMEAQQKEALAKLHAEREAARAKAQALETEQRVAATKRWLEEQREWDSFKEDAQMDARDRKERGEWYEPPLGVPGAIREDDDEEKRLLEQAIRDRLTNVDLLKSFLPLGHITPGEARSETVEVRSWDSEQPLRTFRPADGMPVCPRNGEVVYNGRQANIVLASLRNARMGQFRSVPCSGHYHIVNAEAHRFRGRP